MNAGASINSKAPCHLYSSRLAGGERYVEASPEVLPFTSCLKFRRESTLSPVMPERFYQASTSRRHSRNLLSGIQTLLSIILCLYKDQIFLLDNIWVEVSPFRIHFLNQIYFPVSFPFLELLFSGDCRISIFINLIID